MAYDQQLVAAKLRRWEVYLKRYCLPAWGDIPDFGLYMEQVVVLLRQYLDYLPPELKEEQFITAATINNYVRTRLMPEPRRKKYYRTHIAYLIMICTLKQGLSMAMIKQWLPADLDAESLEKVYTEYARRHRQTATFFAQQVRHAAAPIMGRASEDDLAVVDAPELIAASAVISGFSRLLSEKLLLLDGETLETVPPEALGQREAPDPGRPVEPEERA